MSCIKSAKLFPYILLIIISSSIDASKDSSEIDFDKRTVDHQKYESKIEVKSTLRAGNCSCENGKCVSENGAQVCKCNPEFGLYKPGICKACNCGKNMNCTFNPTLLSDGKKCVCASGYKEIAAKCKGGCRFVTCKKGTCEDGPGMKFKCICPEGYYGEKCEIKDLCLSSPCQNGGNCSMKEAVMNCACPTPFSGAKCEISPCSRNPCKNGGTCTVTKTGFNCTCRNKYTGVECSLAPCNRNPCQNGGSCQITPTGYSCSCRDGFGGTNCSSDACTSQPCKNGGTCKVKGNDFSCSCKAPYSGKKCDTSPCASNPCKNNGTCSVAGTSFKCSCKAPYSGTLCENGPCASNPCKNNGTCSVAGTSFKCSCKAPYSGTVCENGPCASNPCKNNGTCSVASTSFKCSCKAPYSGTVCENGPCSSKPCMNNGTCQVVDNSFKCNCLKPFSGNKCESGPCSENPCLNKGNCTVLGQSYKCSCPIPFSGNKCEIKNCHCENGYCVEENKDLKCVCNPEFGLYDEHTCKECNCGKGANCTFDRGIISLFDTVICICPKGYKVDGEKCVAIDPCLSNPCENGGTCVSHEIEYKCNCPAGYSGDNCEKDPCSSKPCLNGGTCSVTGSTFKCNCKTPFYGDRCGNDTCTAKPCKNNGTCTALSKSSFKCDCMKPFSGKTCEEDPCSKKPCHNEGKCSVSGNTFKCDCKKPYFGDVCSSDPCTQNPCKNGGTCRISDESFKCECKKPFYGDECEKKECLCENGQCIETKDGLKCVCNPEYGPYKEGVCKACNCGPGANCTIKDGFLLFGYTIKCICPAGYKVQGEKCILDFKTTLIASSSYAPTETTDAESTEASLITTISRSSPSEPTLSTSNSTTATKSSMPVSTDNSTVSPRISTLIGTETVGTEETDTTLPTSNSTTSTNPSIPPSTDSSTISQRISTLTRTETLGTGSVSPDSYNTSLSDSTETPTETDIYTGTIDLSSPTPTETHFNNTSLSDSTVTPTKTAFNVSTPDQPITTTVPFDPCRQNPCYNGGTCTIINDMVYCFCRYPYGGRFCRQSEWCMDSWGARFCPNNCDFNFTTKIGRCLCEKGQVFNYNSKKCEPVDMCPFMPGECTGKNEICLYSKCQCEENYKRNDKNECVANFCDSKFNPCGENAICEDLVDEPKSMKCKCKDGYTLIGKSCQKVNKCRVPGLARCQQLCNSSTEACECLPGYKLLPDEISCELINQNETCTKDCGLGVCKNNTEDGEECLCPLTHIWNGTTCVDLCTANQGTLALCPDGNCTADAELGFKCACNDPFTYNSDNVTCRKKSMCVEGDGILLCAEKLAFCLDDFSKAEGYRCQCPDEQAFDTDGTCKNKCDLKENQDHCTNKQGTCSTEGSKIKCVCPPLVTHDIEGNCNKLAEFSYFVSFPLARGKYISSQQSNIRTANVENKDTVDYVAINKDVSDTLKFHFGDNYDASKLFKCSDSPTQNLLVCQVEVQFHYDPKDQKKIIPDKDSCFSKEDNDTCILPPRLMLHKPLIRTDMITEANPCAPGIKKIHCGPASECVKTDNKSQNFICTCSSGFRSNGFYYPFVDEKTIIHRCEDIDECKLPKSCPDNTECLNTYGSYKCSCVDGYQPAKVTKDPKIVGCSAICSSKNCVHGKCDVVGKQFYCKCDDGYVGKNCDQTFQSSTPETGSMRIALIVLSTMTIPLILFSIYIFVKYKTFKESTSQSSYFDDRSSLTMNMVPMAQREDVSDIP